MFFQAKFDRIYIEEQTIKNIQNFWIFFAENESNLKEALIKKDKNFFSLFEKELMKVFFRSKTPIPFCFTGNKEEVEMIIHYGRSSYILTVGNELFEMQPNKFLQNWRFSLQK